MTAFLALPLPLWGGIIGSALTYGLTWFRERRKLRDLFRAPQREAIARIAQASERMSRLAYERSKRKDGWGADEFEWVNKEYRETLAELNHSIMVAQLTVVQPDCYEQLWKLVDAVRAFNYIDATSDAFLSRSRQFSKRFAHLVGVAHFRLPPTQSRRATLRNNRTFIEWYKNREMFLFGADSGSTSEAEGVDSQTILSPDDIAGS
jgi:hypothetical protein